MEALSQTRVLGNKAGLVVLATGLGKTWLAAFDTSSSSDYKRVLFVAHREEILSQAMNTFRIIQPEAHLGKYTGLERSISAVYKVFSTQSKEISTVSSFWSCS